MLKEALQWTGPGDSGIYLKAFNFLSELFRFQDERER